MPVGPGGVGTFVNSDVRLDPRTRPTRTSPLRVASVWRRQPETVPQLAVGGIGFDFRGVTTSSTSTT
jgi:hypothetical protein